MANPEDADGVCPVCKELVEDIDSILEKVDVIQTRMAFVKERIETSEWFFIQYADRLSSQIESDTKPSKEHLEEMHAIVKRYLRGVENIESWLRRCEMYCSAMVDSESYYNR